MLDVAELDVTLDRDLFLRSLLRELAGTLEDVVGLDEAEGYIAIVGRAIGEMLDARYRQAMGVDQMTVDQIAQVLVDLKRRIEGGFRIVSADARQIVLTNSACPFGDKLIGRPSLCMMTMNVFGIITAATHGFARVSITEAIAQGDPRCHVIVDLDPAAESRAGARDFFRMTD